MSQVRILAMEDRAVLLADTPLVTGAVRLFALSDHLHQILIENLDPAAWSARAPGKVRTIAAVFTHVHNVRCKWIRLTAPHLPVPVQLHRAHCTPQQAREALSHSAQLCTELLSEALDPHRDRIHGFRRDALAAPWTPGLEMLCYMLTHEAHHRGQACLLAHQLGFPLPTNVAARLWNWERLMRSPEPEPHLPHSPSPD